jgi:hypothetical protein
VNVRGPKVQYIVWFAPKRAPVSPLLSTIQPQVSFYALARSAERQIAPYCHGGSVFAAGEIHPLLMDVRLVSGCEVWRKI